VRGVFLQHWVRLEAGGLVWCAARGGPGGLAWPAGGVVCILLLMQAWAAHGSACAL